MHREQWQRLRSAYDALTEAPPSERSRLLEEFGQEDPELARELAALIASHDSPDSLFDKPLARLLPPPLEADTVLCGRFRLLRRVGLGGMGEVWAARDEKLNEDIAIKTVRGVVDNPEALKRFLREIQLARRIAHPHICRVHDFFEDAAGDRMRGFLTMELIEGETLAARLNRVGPMPVGEALQITRQILAGLEAAHEASVVHRDLKPANIMLVSGTSGRRAVIMDFGLARDPVVNESDGATVAGMVVGTPEYMAPEQITGAPATPATDLYAVGLILFEMLKGRAPFAGTSTLDSWMRRARGGPEKLSGEVPGVPAHVDAAIARCVEYEASNRFQHARELADALSADVPLVPHRRLTWTLGVGVALAVAAIAATVAWRWQPAKALPAEALRWYDEATQALAEGAPVRALNGITRLLKQQPDFAPAHAALAEIQLELDMPARAQETMLRANELVRGGALPGAYARYVDGIHALVLHDCDRAITALQAMADAAAASMRPYHMVSAARAMERCDRPDDGQALMAAAARLDPLNAAVPLRQARLSARRRDFKAAMTSLDTAEKLFRDRNNVEGVGEVLTLRGTFQVEQDQLAEASVTLAKASDVATSLDDVRQQIRVRLQEAIMHRKQGDLATATRLTAAATDLGRRANLETLAIEGLLASGNVHLVRNQFSSAQELFDRALTIAEAHRHEEYKARARLSLATVFVRMPDLVRAAAEIQAARPYYEQVKQTRTLAFADVLRGQIHILQGQNGDAIRQLTSALGEARKAEDAEQEVVARENLATAFAAAGRYPEALTSYTEVRDANKSAGRTRNEAFATFNVAETLSRMGRFSEADATMRAVTSATALALEVAPQRLRVEALMALRRGRYDAAIDAATRILGSTGDVPQTRALQARLVTCLAAARARRSAQARPACEAASRDTATIQNVALARQARLDVAEARLHAGDRPGAIALLTEISAAADADDYDDRWRLLAVSAAAGTTAISDPGGRLSRELDRLRLMWGEPIYSTWLSRADVALLLAPARLP